MFDLGEIKQAGKEHGLASVQAGEDVLGIAGIDNEGEVLGISAGVGRDPLVRLRTISGDKGDILEARPLLAFVEQLGDSGQSELPFHRRSLTPEAFHESTSFRSHNLPLLVAGGLEDTPLGDMSEAHFRSH